VTVWCKLEAEACICAGHGVAVNVVVASGGSGCCGGGGDLVCASSGGGGSVCSGAVASVIIDAHGPSLPESFL
jgi:hypothetical protein